MMADSTASSVRVPDLVCWGARFAGSGMHTLAPGVRSCEDTHLAAEGRLEPDLVSKRERVADSAEVLTMRK
jgi:hypothetical protein